ncbi:hypothetical protein HBI56_003260 [Parastagonospora nodorum]|nr:hypothetical protein HBH52_152310 [Parastagonospora nodorum]KAH4041717.1 hypothetical protein HBI09_003600 [Parastagonospora nodorum]KAH4273534.1 hypothetical protein HBI03_016630 [Parastagonospora nodorum]KAH4283839.1 hypothetical protein HBI04_003380 [Parastagonospora nodorum]KAH4421678.1 hypothetical protein HBH92_004070 [Parastagonospora nodorum]
MQGLLRGSATPVLASIILNLGLVLQRCGGDARSDMHEVGMMDLVNVLADSRTDGKRWPGGLTETATNNAEKGTSRANPHSQCHYKARNTYIRPPKKFHM